MVRQAAPGAAPRLRRAPAGRPQKTNLAEQIAVLREWDQRWAADSVATSLAVFWGEQVRSRLEDKARRAAASCSRSTPDPGPAQPAARRAGRRVDKLTADFGTWKTPWGDINRFQRLTGDIVQPFSDAAPSIPVPFTSSLWGSLASFGAQAYPGTKRRYGTSGNSFVAVVEFGDKVRARAVTAGGESGDPASPHFDDEAMRYSTGDLREVYFYPEDLKGHTERSYHPGDR